MEDVMVHMFAFQLNVNSSKSIQLYVHGKNRALNYVFSHAINLQYKLKYMCMWFFFTPLNL